MTLSAETKSLLTSKTVWAALISIVAGVATAAFGYTISADDQAQIVTIATGIAGSLGGLGAIYGRVVATKSIK